MKKLKRLIASVLMVFTAFSSIVATPLSAKTNDVSLKVSVVGDGEVKVECDDFDYVVSEYDGFMHDVTSNTNFKFTVTEKSGSFVKATINQKNIEVKKESDGTYTLEHVVSKNEDIVFTFAKNNADDNNESETIEETKEITQNIISNESKDETSSNNEDKKTNEETEKAIEAIKDFDLNKDLIGTVLQPTNDDLAIMNGYSKGDKLKQEFIEARKDKAEELGITKYMNDDYFLSQEYYEKYKTSGYIATMGGWILIDPDFQYEEGIENVVSENESPSISLYSIAEPKVTYLKHYGSFNISFNNGDGFFGNSASSFQVDGYTAFCADALVAPPAVGDVHKAAVESSNAKLKKILYYGFKGPKDQLSSVYGDAVSAFVTSELASIYLGHGSNAGYFLPADRNMQAMYEEKWATFMNDSSKTVPSSFKVYTCESKKTGVSQVTGKTGRLQTLAFWKNEPKGSLQIKKKSANTEMTNGNDCYSLNGAEYGVYSDSAATKKVTTLTIGSDGWSNTVDLNVGSYYVKETKSPKGYDLNPDVVKVVVESGKKTSIDDGTFVDTPKNDPIGIILKKVDADTGQSVPVGQGSLANAEFTVKFYKGDYTDGVDPATQGKTPDKKWVLKTDEDGFTNLDEAYKVSGDSFYKTPSGKVTLPLGTVTIQETKAPNGYHINPAIVSKKIKIGNNGFIDSYNVPIIKENSLKISLTKVQEGTNVQISGARFTHTRPNGAVEELETDSNGNLVMKGVENGIHTLKESYVKPGYDLNPTEIKFQVSTGGIVTLLSNLNGTGVSFNTNALSDVAIKVEDKVSPYDLEIPKVNNHGKALGGAEFTLYADKACTQKIATQITTGGKTIFKGLKDRTHYYFKETKAPKGYRIPVDANGNVHVYEVYVESTPQNGVFDYWVDGNKYTVNNTTGDIHLAGTTKERVVSVKIVNAVGMLLPKTGSNMTLILIGVGVAIMGCIIFVSRKNKKKNEKGKENKGENYEM